MNKPSTAEQRDPVPETTEEEARRALAREVAEDARQAPEQWLEEAEVPKGGE